MNSRTITTICALAWALLASALLLASSDALEARQARELLQRLGGAEWKKEQVRIKSVTPGLSASEAIVEAQIETAFRFTRAGDQWRVAEVRLGDRQWESLELVAEALRREKVRRTTALLREITGALEAYRRERGHYVIAEEASVLVDHLAPRYLDAVIGFDLWGVPLAYRGTAAHYRLSSAGPDRQPGTGDDLVIENGALRTPAE
jgi:hypothetical protein